MRFPKVHGVYPREGLDRAMFLIAFAIGVAGSLALKAFELPILAAVYAGAVLILYAVIAWIGGRLKVDSETVGDNCYYLGFLFTLASLSYTLYEVAGGANAEGGAVSIPDVIAGFGIALSSTILGVFLRVFMMQLRTDFTARDREVRADINKGFLEFRKTLSGMLMQSKAFATESVQMAQERDDRIRQITEKSIRSQQSQLNSNAAELVSQLTKAMSEASRKVISEVAEASRELSTRQQEQTADSIRQLNDLRTSLMTRETDAYRELQERRGQVAAEVESATRLLNDHVAAMERYTVATQKVADMVEKRIIPAFELLEERCRSLPSGRYAIGGGVAEAPDDPDVSMYLTGPRRHSRGGTGPRSKQKPDSA